MAKTELPGTQIKNKSVDPVEDLLLPTGSNSGSFFLKGDGYWASTSSFYSGSYSGSYEGSGYGLTNIQSSSYALSASWAPGGSSVSASYATTSSFSNRSSLADSSTSSSYAVSASWAPSAPTATSSYSSNITENLKIDTLHFGISLSGSIIASGSKGLKSYGGTGTIYGYRLTSLESSSVIVDLCGAANGGIPTTDNSIVSGLYPTLTDAQFTSSYNLATAWTSSVSPNNMFRLGLRQNTSSSYILLEIDILLNN